MQSVKGNKQPVGAALVQRLVWRFQLQPQQGPTPLPRGEVWGLVVS